MTDVILILVLVLIAALAAGYIYRAKKNGKTCIGCPHAGQCGGNVHAGCSGHCGSCSCCSDKDHADKGDTVK